MQCHNWFEDCCIYFDSFDVTQQSSVDEQPSSVKVGRVITVPKGQGVSVL
eukprot:COSAG01_NODE_13764_length_1538_cov_2.428075_1_plen_49_part_10